MKPERVLTFGDGQNNWCFWRWSESMVVARVNEETDAVELDLVDDQQEVPRG